MSLLESSSIDFWDEFEFATNPEPRCPVVLVTDTSGSMHGAPIEELNRGLATFKAENDSDDLARKRIEIAIVSFNTEVSVVQPFVTADAFEPPRLTASGSTAMGAGIVTALDLLDQRKQEYKTNGVEYYRPWLILLTDGSPSDDIALAKRRIAEGERARHFSFFPIGVQGANMQQLQELSPARQPLALNELKFAAFFEWLSKSLSSVSHSQIGEQTTLPSPAGWAEV